VKLKSPNPKKWIINKYTVWAENTPRELLLWMTRSTSSFKKNSSKKKKIFFESFLSSARFQIFLLKLMPFCLFLFPILIHLTSFFFCFYFLFYFFFVFPPPFEPRIQFYLTIELFPPFFFFPISFIDISLIPFESFFNNLFS